MQKKNPSQGIRGIVLLPNFPRPKQFDWWSCAAKCSYAILKYYGRKISYREVKKALGTSISGTDEESVIALFKKRRLKPVKLRQPSLAKIKHEIDQDVPVMVEMDNNGGHYGVMCGYAEGYVFVADPSPRRRCRHTTAQFRKRWHGGAIAVRRR